MRRFPRHLALLVLVIAGVFLATQWIRGEPDDVATPTVTPSEQAIGGAFASPTLRKIATPAPMVTPTPTSSSTPSPSPTPTLTAADVLTLRKGETTEKLAALTFDAGADAGFTDQILDTLEHEQIKATFGMTGLWAEANPDTLKRIADDGHQIINHTYDHQSFTGVSTKTSPLSTDQRADELRHTEQIVQSITGQDPKPYFRPPYGDYDQSVLSDIAADGYTVNVLWTVDSLGWNGLSAPEIVKRCVSKAEPGVIYLMHVGSQSQDAAALPQVIDKLKAEGYRFVTIKELIGR